MFPVRCNPFRGIAFLPLLLLPFALPLPECLKCKPDPSPLILDRHGEELAHLARKDHFRHRPAQLCEIPDALVQATLAAEDKRFFHHPGIDYLSTARALYNNFRTNKTTSGASTITQQLAKISTPPQKRNLWTKLQETFRARQLETQWSKNTILAAYLNRLDYGNHRQGCATAAHHYFNKHLSDLSLAESALLAALPQAPSRLNPRRHPQAALKRRNWILDRLETEFSYNPADIARAKSEPIKLAPPIPDNLIPHLASRLKTNQSTIASNLQHHTARIIESELTALSDKNAQHSALIVIHNPTGEVLALHGSASFSASNGGQINGALTPRSAGSTLKPFTYLLAFQEKNYFPGTIIADIPTTYQTEAGLFTPRNFDRRHHGPVTIRHALANSLNIAAMRTLNHVGGPEPLHHLLTKLGAKHLHSDPTEYGLGLTIGNANTTLSEISTAYSTLARGGIHLPLRYTTESSTPSTSLFSEDHAYLISHILSDNAARSDAFGHNSHLRLPFRCAVKTGTSSNFRDNWCIGYTAEFTVGVWVGNFDNSPMAGISGVSGAAPIFHRTMLALHQNTPATFPLKPNTIANILTDSRTGHRLDGNSTSPHRTTEMCLSSHLPDLADPLDYQNHKALLSQEYATWFHSEHNTKKHRYAISGTMPRQDPPPRIINPQPNATFYLDPDLPGSTHLLKLLSNTSPTWSSNTLQIEENIAHLTPGTHEITLQVDGPDTAITHTIHVESL